jgi:dephospho-CoA kinase
MINKIIAITGGIGSGKSSVIETIKSLGYVCFSADEVYKNLLLDKTFVKGVYNVLNIENAPDVFDRELVSSLVFSNKELLKKLNDYTHPIIMETMISNSKKIGGVVFNEVPLLFESGYENLYDNVIVVCRDKNSRINAVVNRDGLSVEAVENRIKNQLDYENISLSAHTILRNDGSLEELSGKVKAVISEIIKEDN